MRVVCDSSGCCGVKIIRDFYNLLDLNRAINWPSWKGHDEDTYTSEPNAYSHWENVPAGLFTVKERFLQLLNNIKERRPCGMVVVNLAEERFFSDSEDEDEGYTPDDPSTEPDDVCTRTVDAWRPLLLEQGFTEETFINSNSMNMIHRFTLIYGQP